MQYKRKPMPSSTNGSHESKCLALDPTSSAASPEAISPVCERCATLADPSFAQRLPMHARDRRSHRRDRRVLAGMMLPRPRNGTRYAALRPGFRVMSIVVLRRICAAIAVRSHEAPPSRRAEPSLPAFNRETTMAHSTMTHLAVRPFRIDVPEEALADLRRRIAATRWPEQGDGRGCSRRACSSRRCRSSRATGRPTTTGARCEARLNALPQFITEIDGLDIHFIHVRSKHAERVAAHRHARLARLDHRAAEDHRSADQSHGPWRRARRTRSTS